MSIRDDFEAMVKREDITINLEKELIGKHMCYADSFAFLAFRIYLSARIDQQTLDKNLLEMVLNESDS